MSTSKSEKLLAKRQRSQTPNKASSSNVEEFKKQVAKHAEIDQADGREYLVKGGNNENNAESILFMPYRSFGYYTSGIPFNIFKSDQDILLASSVGDHAFYVYNTAKLNLVYMSRFIEQKIVWIEASPDGHVYTALDNCKIV
jgi:hypothetical protein